MLFYRVCHREYRALQGFHVGPYCTEGAGGTVELARMWDAHNGDWLAHPAFTRDVRFGSGNLDYYGDCIEQYEDDEHDCSESQCYESAYDYACGFTDLDSLRTWFYGFRAMLRRQDFVVRVFDVPDDAVRHGDYQAACRIDALASASHTVVRVP